MPLTESGGLGTIISMLHLQLDRLKLLRGAAQGAFGIRIRAVALGIAGEAIGGSHTVLGGSLRTTAKDLNAGHVVTPFNTIDSIRKGASLDRSIHYLKLIKKALVIATRYLTAKLKVELHIIRGVAPGIVACRDLDLIRPAIGGNVLSCGIIEVDIQPVIAALIDAERVCVLNEAQDLYAAILVKRIFLRVKGLAIHLRGHKIVENVCLIKCDVTLCRISNGSMRPHKESAYHHHKGYEAERQPFGSPCLHQNSIASLSSSTPKTSSGTVKSTRMVVSSSCEVTSIVNILRYPFPSASATTASP